VSGEVAAAITGSPQTFTVRPEKIRMRESGAPVAGGLCSADGRIGEVVYLGAHTRYRVELDGGGALTVIQQNADATSMEVLAARGRRVRLVWDPTHNRVVETGG
jgi:putative spermidine/putrescine transport system ATP-binding protein